MNLAQAITEQGLIGMPSTAPISVAMPDLPWPTVKQDEMTGPGPDTLRGYILEIVRAHGVPMSSAEIGEATGESRNTIGTTLTKMRRNGMLKVTGLRGSYLYGLPDV